MAAIFAWGAYGMETSGPNWLSGKDFDCKEFGYFSIRNLEQLTGRGVDQIIFIYRRDGTVKFSVSLADNPEGKITPVNYKGWPWK